MIKYSRHDIKLKKMIYLKKFIINFSHISKEMINYFRFSNSLFFEFFEIFGQDLINNIFREFCEKYPHVVINALQEEYE